LDLYDDVVNKRRSKTQTHTHIHGIIWLALS
jgi:hypothetical protein